MPQGSDRRAGQWAVVAGVRALVVLILAAAPGAAHAQELTLRTDLLFYGDNTEFSNAFRDGDTLLGNWGRVFVDIGINERVRVEGGLAGNWRAGDIERVGQLRPVLALVVGGANQRFVFGTLHTVRRVAGIGPDLLGPHGLPPPLQVETLAFTRPFEAGLQWIVDATRVRQDAWINWQRLNSPRERERFDGGVSGRVAIGRGLFAPYAWHVVHRGGQRYAAGPVADSQAGGAGLGWSGQVGPVDRLTLETIPMGSRFVPDRADPAASLSGWGVLARVALLEGPWRAHVIAWRARDFVKDEGDPNYQSVRQDGTRFQNVRDYAEAGLTRVFRPATQVEFETSARVHRVERDWAYSYRLLARVQLAWRLM